MCSVEELVSPACTATRTMNVTQKTWLCAPYKNIGNNTRLKCYYAIFLVCCGCDTFNIVSVHIQCQASIYTLSLCRGHSWRVRPAKQETMTPPGHLVSPLVCRGPWMSTVGAIVTVHQFFGILHWVNSVGNCLTSSPPRSPRDCVIHIPFFIIKYMYGRVLVDMNV